MSLSIIHSSDTAVEPIQLSESPTVLLLPSFLTAVECDHLIRISRQQLTPSLVVDPDTGVFQAVKSRTSSLTFFPRGYDPIISVIEDRIAHLTKIPVENGEGLQVLHYQIGQEYKPHYDYFDPASIGGQKAMAIGGQRLITMLFYLSDVPAGGETAFPIKKIKVPPRKQDAILFSNTSIDGQPDPTTLHASLPVTSGEKWVATKWLRQKRYGG